MFLRAWRSTFTLVEISLMNSRDEAKILLGIAKDAQAIIRDRRLESSPVIEIHPATGQNFSGSTGQLYNRHTDISNALSKIDTTLSDSYEQILIDVKDLDRISWAGTAHEIREILVRTLRILAPDEYVKKEPWFTQDRTTEGVTHAQRVKYILKQNNRSKPIIEVAQRDLILLDDRIADLVRSTYSRASNAAHTQETRVEVVKILRYFDAIIHDLLDIESD